MTVQPTAVGPAELLNARRSEIAASMARYLAESRDDDPLPEDSDAANQLVDILITSLREAEGAAAAATQPVARRYYSRFGDGLLPILRDVLGTGADTASLSRAIDGYWRAVRSQPQ